MSHRRNTRSGSLAVLLIVVIIAGALGVIAVYNPNLLKLTSVPYNLATNPGYPISGSTTVHYDVRDYADKYTSPRSMQTEVINMNNCIDNSGYGFCSLYGVPSGTLYIPMGMEDGEYLLCYGFLGACSGAELTYNVKTPSGVSSGCDPSATQQCSDARGFDFTGTTIGQSGGYLLTSNAPAGDPTCSNFAAQSGDSKNTASNLCWAIDYAIIQAAQQNNPAGCPVNTAFTCVFTLKSTQVLSTSAALSYLTSPTPNGPGFNSTYANAIIAGCQSNPSATGCPITKSQTIQWYLYRTITSLQFQLTAPTVSVQCNVIAGSCTGTNCFGCSGSSDQEVTGWIQNHVVPSLNQIGLLGSTQITFGLSVSGFVPAFSSACVAGIAQSCWWGIAGAWLGGQGIQTAGCSGTYCGPSNFVQGSHTQLALFQDPGLTMPATLSAAEVLQVSQQTNQTVQSVTQQNTYSSVYSSINTANLGVQYSYNGNGCTSRSVSNCIISPTPIVINVPLIYDIIGSETSFFYQYPAVPPSGGSNAGVITGNVVDGGSKNLFGQFSPIIGACVALGGPCSGINQIQSPTDQNGKFTLNNVVPGTYSVFITANGYIPVAVTQVNVAIGTATNLGTVAMTSTNPAGQICIWQPSYSPFPPYQQTFPGICFPTWVVWAVGIGAGVILVIAILAFSPFGGALLAGAGRGAGNFVGQARGGRRR
jgi:hypothetical protein